MSVSASAATDSGNRCADTPAIKNISTIHDDTNNVTIDEAIDRLGYGRFQRRMLFAVGLCSASDAMEILLLSFLSVAVQVEWDLTHTQSSSLISVVFAGGFCGTLILGRLGDVKGRKPVFVATAMIVATFGLVSCVCQTFHQLLLTRFLVGVGIGGITVPYDTYSEFLPTGSRGKNLSLPSYFWTTGTILVAVIANESLGQDSARWRLLCLYCSIPCIFTVLVVIIAIPESPRWLLAQNSSNEMILEILRDAAQTNGKNPFVLFPPGTKIVASTANNSSSDNNKDDKRSTNDEASSDVLKLFSPQWYRTTISICTVWFGYACMYYGTVLVITRVFSSISTDSTDNENSNEIVGNIDDDKGNNDSEGSFHFDYGAIIISSSAEVTGATIILLTIDRFGRRNIHSLSFVLGGIIILILCFFANSQQQRQVLVLFAFLARMFIFCGASVTWIWTAELFSNDLRTTGHAIANSSGRIGGLVAPFLVSRNGSITTTGIIMAMICSIIVTSAWCLPDTHGMPMGSAVDHQLRQKKVYENVSNEENGGYGYTHDYDHDDGEGEIFVNDGALCSYQNSHMRGVNGHGDGDKRNSLTGIV